MAATYQQLAGAKQEDFQSNPDLAKAFGTAYFGAGNEGQLSGLSSQWASGARNFDSDKAYVLGQLGNLGGSDLRSNLDRYGNWNGSTNPADQTAANKERDAGLASLANLKNQWSNSGLDISTIPSLQNYYKGFGDTAGGGLNTTQTATNNAAGKGVGDQYDMNQDASSKIPTADLASFAKANPGQPFTNEDLTKYNAAGNSSVDTSQPNPTTVNATPFTSTTVQPGAMQTGLAAAQASGTAPQDSGAARAAVQGFLPAAATNEPTFYKPDANSQQVFDTNGKPLSHDEYIAAGGKEDYSNVKSGLPDTTGIEQQLAQDPGYQQLLKDQAEYNSIANQTKSLTDTYKQLSDSLGIPAMNTELMNMKNIIDGSEDDIRAEVTKAGGFATESQVMALTGARNKQLIKNYNNLLTAKTQAQDTLTTMTSLASQDKQFALSAITQKLNIDQQLSDYKDKMQTHAQDAYQKIVDSVGYTGLEQMTGNNPFYTSMIEKTLGLNPGGLAALAKATKSTAFKDYPASYQEYLLAQKDGYKGNYNDYQTMDANRKAVRSTTNNVTYNQAQDQTQQADIQQTSVNLKSVLGRDGFVSPQDWKRAYSDWLDAGHKGDDFVNSFKGYVNPADAPDYGVKL